MKFHLAPVLRCFIIVGLSLLWHRKHIPAGVNPRDNRMSIARQRHGKYAPSTIQAVFPVWSMQSGYKKTGEWVENSSREGIELGRVLEMAVKGDWEEMARKELCDAKKTSCFISSDSETVVNSVPGDDLWRVIIQVCVCDNELENCAE
jgi:hypothetical protein